MNAIMWGSLKYPSNSSKHHSEYKRLKGSSNLHKNIQLHFTWKLIVISPQENTLQKL